MRWYDRLYKLQFIVRYSNIPRIRDENVAQHSFFVSSICLELLEEYPMADVGKVLTMAITHDWAEADVDDIAHDVKRDYPKVKQALKEAEMACMAKYPLSIYNSYIEYEMLDTLEAMIVKLADTIQCIQYLETEVKLGNTYMIPLLEESIGYEASIRSHILDLLRSS
ncbi:MAG: HD domain-containing protein [Ignisphaera sp.]|nr:HD domain-containing protein [Ignisphaera sp.]